MDTKTTKVSTMNPRIIGLNPIFLISPKFVLRPIADRAITIQNFDVFESAGISVLGIIPVLRRATTIRNKMIK